MRFAARFDRVSRAELRRSMDSAGLLGGIECSSCEGTTIGWRQPGLDASEAADVARCTARQGLYTASAVSYSGLTCVRHSSSWSVNLKWGSYF